MRLFKRKKSKLPEWTGVRHDYRKQYWGHSCEFVKDGDKYRGHMWSSRRVQVGDRMDVGDPERDLLLVEVRRMSDPNDMYFFIAVETRTGE